jgi:hypothetical protein
MNARHRSTLHCFIKSQNTLQIHSSAFYKASFLVKILRNTFLSMFLEDLESASLNVFLKFCYVWNANITFLWACSID